MRTLRRGPGDRTLQWTLIGLGAAAGFAAGLVPGLHTNTLCAVTLAALPQYPGLAVGVVAAAFAHLFAQCLPTTYLGVPDPDVALGLLPAHRLVMAGRGRDAIHAAAHATLGAVLACVALALPYKWLVAEPGRFAAWMKGATPWLLLALLAWLVVAERRKGVRAVAWALALVVLSGVLALVAGRLVASPWLGSADAGAAVGVGPVLAGLFGCAGLVVALRRGACLPPQRPPASRRAPRLRGSLARAVPAALATSVVPGLASGVAAAFVAVPGRRRRNPDGAPRPNSSRPMLAAIAALNASHTTLALVLLWVTGATRTGLAVAVARLQPPTPWTPGHVPRDLAAVLAAAVAGAALGYVLLLAADGPAARLAHRLPARTTSAAALALVVGLEGAVSGPLGLAVLAVATLVGLLPHATGVRRVHLAGALAVPVIVARWA